MVTDTSETISAHFLFEKRRAQVLGSQMAYVDVGLSSGSATVFLHGNPTSSYLWRNIIPHVSGKSRCVAPDLIGFGDSDKLTGLAYRVVDHQRYLDAFLDAVLPTEKLTLVIHDWGSVLGFDWARRHEDRVAGLAFMEFNLPIDSWNGLPQIFVDNFRAFRNPELGRQLLINQNIFIEKVLPLGVLRQLTDKEMTHYRRPFLEPTSREPVWRFTNEIPIEGKPADVAEKAQKYIAWLLQTDLPKLFFWVTPGINITKEVAERFIQELRNTKTVFLGPGLHYVQEDHPHAIGREIAQWLAVSLE